MKQNILFRILLTTLIVLGISVASYAQLSPSGQVFVKTPSVLSGCGRDTVFVEFTNVKGPVCPAPGFGGGNLTLVIDVPGDTTIKYQPASVGSFPAGATEVSYVSATKKLTLTVPVPAYGSTVRAYFVVNASCKVVELPSLPFFKLNATYPVGYGTATENWNSGLMNIGNGVLNVQDNLGTPMISAFNETYPNDGFYMSNTGFGSIHEVNVTLIKSDSLYNYIGGALNTPWWYRYNS